MKPGSPPLFVFRAVPVVHSPQPAAAPGALRRGGQPRGASAASAAVDPRGQALHTLENLLSSEGGQYDHAIHYAHYKKTAKQAGGPVL